MHRQPFRPTLLAALSPVLVAVLACNGVDDIIGQRPPAATPTVLVFSTATPGGRVSVWLTTPTGQAPEPPQRTITPVGQIVAPAATATAAFATLQAATATAGFTPPAPIFQPRDCPPPGAPIPPPKPANFSQYPEIIGRFLSAGGPTTILESTLRSWGAVNEGAVVQGDTDLTGDGVNEIIVTIYDPAVYQSRVAAPGQMLIFGCAQKGYRLLLSTVYTPNTMLPALRRVGDMNGDFRAEVAYSQQVCESGQCTQFMDILSWNAVLGVFKPLNETRINATQARILISDADNDGILEVSIFFSPAGDPAAGPPRRSMEIWDWDGVGYRLAVKQIEPPVYRIHAAHDADFLFVQALQEGNWRDAIRLYDRVRDEPTLQPWLAANETIILRAYASYKKMLAQIANRQRGNADGTLAALAAENPPGSPGEGYALVAQAFLSDYNTSRDRKKACQAALNVAQTRPEVLAFLNAYGTTNRTYNLADLCPFTEK